MRGVGFSVQGPALLGEDHSAAPRPEVVRQKPNHTAEKWGTGLFGPGHLERRCAMRVEIPGVAGV